MMPLIYSVSRITGKKCGFYLCEILGMVWLLDEEQSVSFLERSGSRSGNFGKLCIGTLLSDVRAGSYLGCKL